MAKAFRVKAGRRPVLPGLTAKVRVEPHFHMIRLQMIADKGRMDACNKSKSQDPIMGYDHSLDLSSTSSTRVAEDSA